MATNSSQKEYEELQSLTSSHLNRDFLRQDCFPIDCRDQLQERISPPDVA
jgi:hypothetical protein